jgi:hypothetical protein
MKYRLGSVTIEAIDTYVRVTCDGFPGKPRIAVTRRECPTATEVAQLVADIRGCWPDKSVLQACGRAATDAAENRTVLELP